MFMVSSTDSSCVAVGRHGSCVVELLVEVLLDELLLELVLWLTDDEEELDDEDCEELDELLDWLELDELLD